MFIGREKELKALEHEYSKPGSNTYAVYGRRRVGKTALLLEFCKRKPSIFLTGYQNYEHDMFRYMEEAISDYLGEKATINESGDLFRILSSIKTEEKIVVVVDEFPDMARLCPATPSQLRTFIDTKMGDLNMMMIICGSSISAMLEELNDGGGPLFGRFPIQVKILPLKYTEARKLNPGLSEEDRMRVFCISGGLPSYHIGFGSDTPEAGIKRMFLGVSPWGLIDTNGLTAMELNPHRKYSEILSNIHSGSTASAIAAESKMGEAECIRLLNNLIFLGMVRKDVCFGMKKRTLYRISDGMIDFCYEIIRRYSCRMDFFDEDRAYENIREEVSSFYGHRFEEICKEYVADNYECRTIEDWWGAAPVFQNGIMVRDDDGKVVTEDGDIDIVARARSGDVNYLLLGECKFTNKPVGRKELETLIMRSESLNERSIEKRYVLFSRSGFSDSLRDYLDEHSKPVVDLVDMDTMERWAESR